MVFIIDDDRDFAECIARMVGKFCNEEVEIFGNGVEAMAVMGEELPKMIFLDVLLDGPDGFTFLNELMSYNDTEKIPVILMSSLNFSGKDLKSYGITAVLDKAKMRPADVKELVEKYVAVTTDASDMAKAEKDAGQKS